MYYEMKKKNVFAIKFNSSEFRYTEIKDLLIKEKTYIKTSSKR